MPWPPTGPRGPTGHGWFPCVFPHGCEAQRGRDGLSTSRPHHCLCKSDYAALVFFSTFASHAQAVSERLRRAYVTLKHNWAMCHAARLHGSTDGQHLSTCASADKPRYIARVRLSGHCASNPTMTACSVSGSRGNVLVHPEQVLGIKSGFQCCQARIVRPVGRAHHLGVFAGTQRVVFHRTTTSGGDGCQQSRVHCTCRASSAASCHCPRIRTLKLAPRCANAVASAPPD